MMVRAVWFCAAWGMGASLRLGAGGARRSRSRSRSSLSSLSVDALPDSTAPLAPRTELSDSFDGAVSDAVGGLLRAVDGGAVKIRVDFDTSMGDATFTKLSASFEFARGVIAAWAQHLGPNATLCVYFPDAGAAALARQQWKMDSAEPKVPGNVRLAAFPRDKPSEDDAAFFLVCPRAPESAQAAALVDFADERLTPIVLLNPELVDMGTTGFGYAGRMLKDRVLSKLTQAYYLRTLDTGALARTYPLPFTVWQEDRNEPDGYVFVKTETSCPNDEMLDEIFEEFNNPSAEGDEENPGVMDMISGLAKFIDNFQRM